MNIISILLTILNLILIIYEFNCLCKALILIPPNYYDRRVNLKIYIIIVDINVLL